MLERSSYDPDIGDAISNISAVRFFEESWLVALSRRSSNPHLLVFNTLLPQQDPKSWKILQLPRLPQDMNYIIPAQHGNSSVEFPEFSMDPAERNFIVSTSRGLSLVIPVGLFIRVTSSVRASPASHGTTGGKAFLGSTTPMRCSFRSLVRKRWHCAGCILFRGTGVSGCMISESCAGKRPRTSRSAKDMKGRY